VIVVTGGAGFIGSNLVHALNAATGDPIVVVEEPLDPVRHANLVGADVADLIDPDELLRLLGTGSPRLRGVEAILHQGAISSTTDPDGGRVMARNYEYTRSLVDSCATAGIPLVYASTAAVYGDAAACAEDDRPIRPRSIYALSKALADRYVLSLIATGDAPQVVGLRYFNVYGPREGHKGAMASIARQLDDQLARDGRCRIFGPSHGLPAGEQRRDFVHVDDVVAVAMWAVEHRPAPGVLDCGTGVATSFNQMAELVLAHHPGGVVEYVPFPTELASAYQPKTRASLGPLRRAGCDHAFRDVCEGVSAYLSWRRAVGEVDPGSRVMGIETTDQEGTR
jgi:ADP-L-glycero-D-manno-heptose 6-epimerase